MERKSILIVEDEQIAAIDLKETLQSLGYRVIGIAPSGERAITMVKGETPDLILMDIHLSGKLSGIEAAEQIISHHSVPIIYVTAYADPELVERAKRTRPYGYIIKPYDERAIRTEIEIALYKFGLDRNFHHEYANLAQWVQERTEQLARVNEALKKSETRYRLLFERSGEGFFILDAEGVEQGRIVEVNVAGAAMHGYQPDELLKMKIADLADPENSITTPSRFAAIMGGEWIGGEISHVRKDGSVFPLDFHAGLLELEGHRYVFSVMRDITGQKLAEKLVQESEKKFREIFNAANDAIHLHEIDERGLPGKFIDVNEVACRMLQYSKEQLLAKKPLDLATTYHSRPLEQIGEEIKTKGSVIFETEHRRNDGVVVPVEVNFHIVVIQGQRLGLSIIRDLTRRKRDESAFRRLSADHKAIIDHMPAMIWYKDTRNNFVRVNPAAARAFGMRIEDIEGKNASVLFPNLAEKYYQDDLEVIHSGTPKLGIIEQMTTAGGERLWVQTDKIPLRDERGNITGILLFVVDISERKRAEDALALASRKLNLLSSITRHDILNQLTALKTYIELSKEELDTQKLTQYIGTEEKIANTLERQINFTREYQDLGGTVPVWQNVLEKIDTAVAALPMRNTTVIKDIAGIEVFADLLFEKVFYNLIDNALRYGGQKMTTIRITTRDAEKGLVIAVEDDGGGISTEDKKRLFERGFGHNTGLGLFLSREILAITGITITETGEPGKGARFEIVVPAGGYRFTRPADTREG